MLQSAIDLIEAARKEMRLAKERFQLVQMGLQDIYAKIMAAEKQVQSLTAENKTLSAKLKQAEEKNAELKAKVRAMLEQ